MILNKKRDIYLISDLHGNLDLFKKIIDENIKKTDYLFILGDMIEKGNQNIDILDYIIELKEFGYHIYPIVGNCDLVINEFKNPCDISKLEYYSKVLGKTILNEFYDGLNIDYNKDFNVNEALDLINKKYKKYFDFINTLPKYYYINDDILLIHADLDESKKKKILTTEELDNLELKKLNVCGHMPVMMMNNNEISLDPVKCNDFLYIDGGNNVVMFGGLNLIKLNLKTLSYTFKTYYNYPLYKVTSKQESKGDVYIPNLVNFNDYKVLDNNIVKYKYNDTYLYSPCAYLDRLKAYDSTNMFINVSKGDLVYVSLISKEVAFVVKNNIAGLVDSSILKKI